MKDREASAPGLSEPAFWISKSDADWLERVPNVNGQIQALRLGGASRVPVFLTRASAATVGEPSKINVEECAEDVFKHGHSVGYFDIPKEAANMGCALASAVTGDRFDWHYFAGRVHVKLLKSAQQQAEPGAYERSQQLAVFLRLAEVVQADSKRTRDRYPAQSERADQLAAFMKTACKLAAQSGQRAGVAEPEGWREFITEVAQQKPEKPDYWSSCGQCQRNADRAQDMLAAAPTQQQEENK